MIHFEGGAAAMARLSRFISVLGVVTGLGVQSASASPLARVQATPLDSAIEQVRDGCGYGYRFSHRLRACVPDRRRPPPPRYVRPVDPAAVAAGAIIGGVAAGIAASQRPVRRAPPPRVRYYHRY